MRRRSNLMVLLGIAFFIVGLGTVFVVTNDDDDGGGSSAAAQNVPVVVASRNIEAGALGDELVDEKAVRVIEVASNQVVPGAVGSLTQLQGARFILGFAKDQQLTLAGMQTVTASVAVPKGFEAVAVQLEFVSGAAGYVRAGDRINLYGVLREASSGQGRGGPRAELMLTNVEVLDVNIDIPSRRSTASADPTQPAAARVGGNPITFLLALRTDDIEKVVYTTEFQSLYATLVAKDAPPAGPTGGRDGDNILDEEPNVAFNG